MAANYQKYLNDFVEALKLEFIRYYEAVKGIDCKTFFTPENLLSIKENFCADAKKVLDGVVWSEKLITIICVIHAFIIVNILQDCKSLVKQIFYVVCLTLLSFSSTYLNQLGAENWNKFATKNYFDKNGKFMLLFLNIPVFVELLICLVNIVILSVCPLCCGKKKAKKTKTAKKSIPKKPKPEPKKPVSKDTQLKGNVKKPSKKAPVKKFN